MGISQKTHKHCSINEKDICRVKDLSISMYTNSSIANPQKRFNILCTVFYKKKFSCGKRQNWSESRTVYFVSPLSLIRSFEETNNKVLRNQSVRSRSSRLTLKRSWEFFQQMPRRIQRNIFHYGCAVFRFSPFGIKPRACHMVCPTVRLVLSFVQEVLFNTAVQFSPFGIRPRVCHMVCPTVCPVRSFFRLQIRTVSY